MTKEHNEKRLQQLRAAEQQMQFNLVAVRGQIAEREWELDEINKGELKEAAERAVTEAKATETVAEEPPESGDLGPRLSDTEIEQAAA